MIGVNDLFNTVVDLQAALTEVKNEPPTRDQLAAMAMQGLAASGPGGANENCWPDYPTEMAKRAYEIADAMIALRAPKEVSP